MANTDWDWDPTAVKSPDLAILAWRLARTAKPLGRTASLKKLKKQPWAQTPQGRAAIHMLETRYPGEEHLMANGRPLPVYDWLLREFRKGRLVLPPSYQAAMNHLVQAEERYPDQVDGFRQVLDGPRPDAYLWPAEAASEAPGQVDPVQPGMVLNVAKMLQDMRKHEKNLDIMNHSWHDLAPIYKDWEQNYRERDPNSGRVVHAFPNGWSVRQVVDPIDQAFEAEDMRNCLADKDKVDKAQAGEHHIFSLRDSDNRPHANVLIRPTNPGGHWEGGTVADLRGKANMRPNPEYGDYLKQWFASMASPPAWQPDPAPPGADDIGTAEEWGLPYPGQQQERPEDPEQGLQPVQARWVFSDRLDELTNHPGNQDPQVQGILNMLAQRYHSDKNDVLFPWLLREVRNGNIGLSAYGNYGDQFFHHPISDEGVANEVLPRLREHGYLNGETPEEVEQARDRFERDYGMPVEDQVRQRWVRNQQIPRELIDKIGKWFHDAPKSQDFRRGVDLLNRNNSFQSVLPKVEAYEDWYKKKRDQSSVVHRGTPGTPAEGHYIKQMFPDELAMEGRNMNNCIGGGTYEPLINGKQRLLYSVRDANGNPSVDVEIKPKWWYNTQTHQKMEVPDSPYPMEWSEEMRNAQHDPNVVAMPQEGGVVQIQGKNNSPPHEKYHHLVKDWFNSKHFLPDSGEDWRPRWDLPKSHFTSMRELYSPVGQHVVYYHPGDYGLPEAGVTTDYKQLLPSIADEARIDPEDQRLKFLVNWSRHNGDIPQLMEALQDPEVKQRLVSQVPVDEYNGDYRQRLTDWMEQNPQPQRPGIEAPAHYDEMGNYVADVGHAGYPAYQAQRDLYLAAQQQYHDAVGTYQQRQAEQREQLLNQLRDQQFPTSPIGRGWNYLNENVQPLYDELQGGDQQSHQASVKETDWPIPHWLTFQHFANEQLFNKVRNMLRKNNQLTPENELALGVMRHAYPNNSNLAEWLHREFRKGRITHNATNDIAGAEGWDQRAEEYDRFVGQNPADAEYYGNLAQEARRNAERIRNQVTDPDYLSKRQLMTPPETDAHGYTVRHGQIIAPEHLDSLSEMLDTARQRGEGINIMKQQVEPMLEAAKEHEMSKKLVNNGGLVLGTLPNGYTVRYITTGPEADLESEMLGHCINAYKKRITTGGSLNLSLRDPKGLAHATWELKPGNAEAVNWDGVAPQDEEGRPVCLSCGAPLAERGTACPNCGADNPSYSPEFIEEMKKRHQEMVEDPNYKTYYGPQGVLAESMEFLENMRKHGLIKPDFASAKASQVQGKSNIAPKPEYQNLIRQFYESYPYEERPHAAWEHYYMPGGVQHANHLHMAGERGTDDFGLRMPNRPVDWQSVLGSLQQGSEPVWTGHGGVYLWKPKPAQANDQYDPALGQTALDWAKQNGQLKPLYNQLTEWGSQPGFAGKGHYLCPPCGSNNTSWDAYYGEGHCGDCGRYFTKRQNPQLAPQAVPTAPNYSPYQAQVIQHLGPQLADDPQVVEGLPDEHFAKTAGQYEYRKPTPHTGAWGQPCTCLYHPASHYTGWDFTSATVTCDVCGDPLEEGQCKRCNWGGWSQAMPGNPVDVTKDMKPAIQP